jgi:hypothetical protein
MTNNNDTLLESLIRGTYDAFKYSFQILMMYSMVTAAQTCYPTLVESLSIIPNEFFNINHNQLNNQPKLNLTPSFLFIIVFVPTFVRFFIGDLRYLDLSYRDLTSVAKKTGPDSYREEILKFSGGKRFFDMLMLLTHGVLFIFLGKSLESISHCAFVYSLLMLINVIWLSFSVTRAKKYTYNENDLTGTESMLIQHKRKDWAPRFWIKNNLAFIVIIILVALFFKAYHRDPNDLFYWIFVGLVVLNSLIDFRVTWFFYFPDYEEILDHESTPQNPIDVKKSVSKFSEQ